MSSTAVSACAQHRPTPAPVDRYLADSGIRLRRLPGEICLHCHSVSAPLVVPNAELSDAIARCLAGDPSGLVILKTRPSTPNPELPACLDCGKQQESVLLDVALGENCGLVVEGLPGSWCWNCHAGTLANAGEALRERLTRLDIDNAGQEMPSLFYETPPHPRSVQFEVSTRCNLRCGYCTHRYLEEKSDVPPERFLSLLDAIELDCVDNVDFTGLGEAVLHTQLPTFVREVRQRGEPTHIRIVTNGVSLSPERAAPLIDAGITSIAFSIDSLDPARFAAQRGGAKLAIVLANLEKLVELRSKENLSHLRIKIKSVLIEQPYGEAEQILNYSAKLGLDMPHFSCLDTRESMTSHYSQSWLEHARGADRGVLFMLWAEQRWMELTNSPPEPETVGPSAADRRIGYTNPVLMPVDLCRWTIDAAFIAASGGTLSCCEQMVDIPRTEFGYLQNKPLRRLWAEELFWAYRLPLSLGLVPKQCVGCARAPQNGVPLESLSAVAPASIG